MSKLVNVNSERIKKIAFVGGTLAFVGAVDITGTIALANYEHDKYVTNLSDYVVCDG